MTHDEDGNRLVDLARDVIVHELAGPAAARPEGAWFEQLAATFVTITRRGVLHGCIGTIVPHRSLLDDVAHNASAAAFTDPRSEPFRVEWLPDMGVEVTLLSPLERLSFADEEDALRQIVPGLDGLVLAHGPYSSTLLPQVWDSLPDRREFVDQLKVKAGFQGSIWPDEVELHRFRVQKWGDRRTGLRTASPDGAAAPGSAP